MIAHELVLLGLLKESPKHGYDIKKKIKEILSLFAGLEMKSIYYPLNVLEKRGLVTKRINRQGRRPRRFVYELTSRGDTYFKSLLSKSFLDFRRPQFSLDLSLYFLKYIKPAVAKRRLRARMQVLKRLSRGLTQMSRVLEKKRNPSLLLILEHNLQMVLTEYKFLAHLISTV
jgi:DNA-binding PadR family transcriptional regulator